MSQASAPSIGFDAPSSRPHYWSAKTLQEDKKRCLVEFPHVDHTIANTLEFLHADKKDLSNKAIGEKKKLHQGMKNDMWRRRSSTPTHPYAFNQGDQKKFWSHLELQDAKRKLAAEIPSLKPQSARDRPVNRTPYKSGSFSARSSGADENDVPDQVADGCRSPTIKELMRPHKNLQQDHPHNESVHRWWETVRERRAVDNPHKSFEKFDIKKHHHVTDIHSRDRTPAHDDLMQSAPQSARWEMKDPKSCAYQGLYPRGETNEAWAPPRGDETPPSRYHSQELFTLDKKRHAAPVDGGHRTEGPTQKPGLFHQANSLSASGIQPPNFSGGGSKPDALYRSNYTLQQHKKKHLALMKNAGMRGGTNGSGTFGGDSVDDSVPNSPTTGVNQAAGNGFKSHREMQYCKRFNTVYVKPQACLHKDDGYEKPWPRAGDGEDKASSSSTPPYPSMRMQEPFVASRSHNHHALTRSNTKTGIRTSRASSQSDTNLLHSSRQELAERKAVCATSIRHSPQMEFKGTKALPHSNASNSDLGLRRDSAGSTGFISHREMEFAKTVHKLAHDDARRKPPQSKQPPVGPTPRSGQWTPAHI